MRYHAKLFKQFRREVCGTLVQLFRLRLGKDSPPIEMAEMQKSVSAELKAYWEEFVGLKERNWALRQQLSLTKNDMERLTRKLRSAEAAVGRLGYRHYHHYHSALKELEQATAENQRLKDDQKLLGVANDVWQSPQFAKACAEVSRRMSGAWMPPRLKSEHKKELDGLKEAAFTLSKMATDRDEVIAAAYERIRVLTEQLKLETATIEKQASRLESQCLIINSQNETIGSLDVQVVNLQSEAAHLRWVNDRHCGKGILPVARVFFKAVMAEPEKRKPNGSAETTYADPAADEAETEGGSDTEASAQQEAVPEVPGGVPYYKTWGRWPGRALD